MQRETAKGIYGCLLAFDPLSVDLEKAVDAIDDDTLRRQFREAVGDVTAKVFADLMYPLDRRFPDIIPETERPEP